MPPPRQRGQRVHGVGRIHTRSVRGIGELGFTGQTISRIPLINVDSES
jgi:hypothetical protein